MHTITITTTLPGNLTTQEVLTVLDAILHHGSVADALGPGTRWESRTSAEIRSAWGFTTLSPVHAHPLLISDANLEEGEDGVDITPAVLRQLRA